MRQFFPYLFLFLLLSCSQEEICLDADLVLTNSKIYTLDTENNIAESVAIKDDSIIFVGTDEEAKSYKCNAKVINLSNAFIYPGFIDSHVHLKATGYRELSLNLQGSKSLKEMLTSVQIYANSLEAGEWVIGRGWIEKKWPEGRFPTIESLIKFLKINPFYLRELTDMLLLLTLMLFL